MKGPDSAWRPRRAHTRFVREHTLLSPSALEEREGPTEWEGEESLSMHLRADLYLE